MGREKLIRLSEREKKALDVVRAFEFGTDSATYGDTIRVLVNDFNEQNRVGEEL